MGLGNTDYGDDGLGVRMAEKLESAGVPHVIVAGTMPERYIDGATSEAFDYLIFLDAVEFGAVPGSVVFLDSEEMAARFPQISTHKISLGLMAKLVEEKGTTKAHLLGVQPESIKTGTELSLAVRETVELLCDLIVDIINNSQAKEEEL
jgi:hydrogenase 3 maturation protease